MVVDIINLIIDGLALVLEWVIGLLPDSPFTEMRTEKPEGINLGHITWFIPFPTMISHFALFLVAVGTYYVYRVLARWIKLVRS